MIRSKNSTLQHIIIQSTLLLSIIHHDCCWNETKRLCYDMVGMPMTLFNLRKEKNWCNMCKVWDPMLRITWEIPVNVTPPPQLTFENIAGVAYRFTFMENCCILWAWVDVWHEWKNCKHSHGILFMLERGSNAYKNIFVIIGWMMMKCEHWKFFKHEFESFQSSEKNNKKLEHSTRQNCSEKKENHLKVRPIYQLRRGWRTKKWEIFHFNSSQLRTEQATEPSRARNSAVEVKNFNNPKIFHPKLKPSSCFCHVQCLILRLRNS